MTAVRPDDTAGTGERCQVCEGIDIPGATHNPAAPYCTFATRYDRRLQLVEGSRHPAAAWYAEDVLALVAAVREAEARADQLANERVDLQNSIGGYVVSTDELVRQRADAWRECESLAEERDEAVARAERAEELLALSDANFGSIPQAVARAERAERALAYYADGLDVEMPLPLTAVSGEAPNEGSGWCVECGRQLTTEEAIRSDACPSCDPPKREAPNDE